MVDTKERPSYIIITYIKPIINLFTSNVVIFCNVLPCIIIYQSKLFIVIYFHISKCAVIYKINVL